MKALDKLREISRTLSASGIESAEKEAELLVREVLDISLTDLYKEDPEVNDEHDAAIGEMVGRRAVREPLQYILGHTDFLGLKILVGEGVLIPRPETELMAEYAVKTVRSKKSEVKSEKRTTVLDLCTGSGCLALAFAREFPEALVYGTDISGAALKYANENASINGVKNVKFLKGHLFDPLEQNRLFDIIISNPPYIRTKDIDGLQPEIREWEPVNALDGGVDGLDLYREIVPSAGPFLADDGILMLELGAGCSTEVHGIFESSGYSEIKILKDYAGIERIIHGKWTR